MKVHIKHFCELNTAELYEILRLRSEIFVVEQNCVYNDLDNLDQEGYHLYITEAEQIVSYVRILKGGTRFKETSIGRVVTKEKYRHRGFSTTLMKKAIAFIKEEWKGKTIKISAQTYLQSFYESLGFVITTAEFLEDGIPHLGMELKREF